MSFAFRLVGSLLAASLLSLPLAATAQGEDAATLKAIEDAIPGTLIHNPLTMTWSPDGKDMKYRVVPSEGLMTGEAVEIKVKKPQKNPWDVAYRSELPEAISTGDTIQVLYWVRTAAVPKGEGAADVAMFLGRNVDPYDSVIYHEFQPGSDWQIQQATGTASADYPAGEVKLEFHLGKAAQTVEFGPVYVSRLD